MIPTCLKGKSVMVRNVSIFALLVLIALLVPTGSFAYTYGYDPAKAVGNGGDWYMELAQDPTLISGGIYDGEYEYFFDLYTLGESFYMTDIVGLDNSKILNAQTTTPDGDAFKTQRWGDPDGYGNRAAWADATGRIVDFWSTDVNADQISAEETDKWRGSYDNLAGGWNDAGLGWYAGSSTDNPHSYSDYVEYSGFGFDMWKAELTGPGQGVHWFYTLFGVSPAQDTIYIPGVSVGAWANTGVGGLVYTLRVVYDEPIEQANIGWSPGGATAQYPILGDFAVATNSCPDGIAGDANCDGYVDIASDILTAFSNFTGPGSFGKTRAEGDVHRASGPTASDDPHDGDVDVSDILTMFGAFTGPPPDEAGGALGAPAEAGDPAIPDLIYDASTGEVVFDLDGAAGLIGYSLKSAGGFLAGGHTPILGGVTTSLTTELAEAALSTPGLPASIGFVFPIGMDLAALMAFLTDNTVSTGLGAPLVPFDLVVVGGAVVPEPATVAMALMGLVGLGLVATRRQRAV